jgi:hypothetical protein
MRKTRGNSWARLARCCRRQIILCAHVGTVCGEGARLALFQFAVFAAGQLEPMGLGALLGRNKARNPTFTSRAWAIPRPDLRSRQRTF